MKYLLLSTFHQIVVCIMRALPVESSNYLFREISMPPFLPKILPLENFKDRGY